MSSSGLLHIIWGPVECNDSTTSPSHDGSSEACRSARSQLPNPYKLHFRDPSSSSNSEQSGKELWAPGSTAPNHQGVEQSSDSASTAPADGPRGFHKQAAKRVHFQDLPGPSARECPGVQAARTHKRRVPKIVDAAHGWELGDDVLRADGWAAFSDGLDSVEPLDGEAALLDSLSMWSRGSAKHQTGDCRPCHYAHTKAGCLQGRNCSFCHLPHTSGSSQRPCKTRRKQCHRLVLLLEQQQPGELRRLMAREAAAEAGPEDWPAPQGLALTVQQLASKSPYLWTFMKKLWGTKLPSETLAPHSTEATSSSQTDSHRHDEGEETPMRF